MKLKETINAEKVAKIKYYLVWGHLLLYKLSFVLHATRLQLGESMAHSALPFNLCTAQLKLTFLVHLYFKGLSVFKNQN